MKVQMLLIISLLAAPLVAFAGVGAPSAAPSATTVAVLAAANQSCRTLPAGFSSPPVLGTTAPASLWQDRQYGQHVTLSATPGTALRDQPVTIRVSGLAPNAPVALRAEMKGLRGLVWRSRATFMADRHGIVDVARAAPRYGSYSGVHPMGLVWSMLPMDVKRPAYHFFIPKSATETVSITALAGDRTLAKTSFVQLAYKPSVKKVKLDRDGLVGFLFSPAKRGPHPAVIVLGGSEGGLHPQVEEAALLASHGFVALGLAYFRGMGARSPMLAKLPKELVKIPLEYFKRAALWLAKQPGVSANRIGIVGWSKGAEAALLLASTYPKLFHAVVAWAPSSVVWSGIHYGPGPLESSWTLADKPVPFASFAAGPGIFNPETKTVHLLNGYLEPMLSGKIPARAAIKVERIEGPVLLLSGTDDQIWPSTLAAARIMARLERHHHSYADESLCYRDAGHYITWPYGPAITAGASAGPVTILMGGKQRAYAFADANFWPKMLAFLHHALNKEPEK